MDTITAISITELAKKRVSAVRSGRITHGQGKESVMKWIDSQIRDQMIEYLTRNYNPESVNAFKFFRIL